MFHNRAKVAHRPGGHAEPHAGARRSTGRLPRLRAAGPSNACAPASRGSRAAHRSRRSARRSRAAALGCRSPAEAPGAASRPPTAAPPSATSRRPAPRPRSTPHAPTHCGEPSRGEVSQSPSNHLRSGQVLPPGHLIQRRDLLHRQTHSHHLHRLSTPPRTPTPTPLQLLDVVPGFRLVCPVLDLIVTHNANIV